QQQAKTLCPDAMFLPPMGLGNFAALARHAEFVIANDSGVSHVAAGLGIKQITLVGVTDSKRTGPWNPQAIVLGSKGAWPSVTDVLEAIDRIRQ
ncbi:MAG TPA: heptosyltransferase, partial [Sutterella sp.]|nr:heptosyltransferase [Sutterella sp.]